MKAGRKIFTGNPKNDMLKKTLSPVLAAALNISGLECIIKFLRKHGKVDYANVRRANITRDPDVPLL